MEDSWQMKCSSTLQSSTLSVASSSSYQELRNQTERNMSYCSYPHDPRDLRRKVLGTMQGPPFPNYPNLSSQKSSHLGLGNSFLALLSGPPSLLQCDFKELSNSRLMSDSNSVVVNAVGGGTTLSFNGLPPEYPSEQNLQLGADSCVPVSTRAMSVSNCSSNSVLPDLPSPELDMTFIHRMISCSEKAKSSISSSVGLHDTVPSNAGKVSRTNVQVSSVEVNSSISNHSSSFLSNCPRVFCLGTGGYLLISSTGLLGIVCSCHYLHMSVLKFCEHSGLCGGNTGDSVRLESGETIAMWRKLYFQKFGIRIPEDQSDWDWPEGVTATSGLIKSRTSLPNISCNFSHLAHSSEDLLRSGQISDNVILSNLHTNQNLVSNASQNKQKRNAQDGINVPLNGLIGTSQRNMHIGADTQIMEHHLSGFPTASKSMGSGPQDGSRSITSHTDSILKNGDSSIIHTAMQDLRTIGQKSDFSVFKNAPNNVFVGGDAAFSNIELKLGQPYQSSQNSKSPDQRALGTQLLDTFANPAKLIFPDEMIHNASHCQGKVVLGQSLYCAANPCGPNAQREQSQLNLGNSGFDNSNVNNAGTLEKYRGNLTQNAVVSLLSNFNLLAENSVQMKPNNNTFNHTEQTVPRSHYYESRITKCNSFYVPWNNGNGLERQLTNANMGSHGLTDNSRGVKFASDGPYFTKDSGNRIHKQTETETATSHPFVSAAQGSNCELYQLSSAPLVAPDDRSFSNYSVNMPSFGGNLHVDHVNRRSLNSNIESGLILPSQVVTKGLPLAPSNLLDQTSATHREEGIGLSPHLLDDNLRILALRHILELSKQKHAFSSFGMNRWEGNSHFHPSVAESSAPREQCNGPSLASGREATEAAARAHLAGVTTKFSVDEDTNGCCDLSTLIGGISIHYEETAAQGQLSSDPLQNEHLSTSRSQKNMSGPSEHERCCRVPSACLQHSCNCSVHINCAEMNLDSRVGSFPNALKEQRGAVNGEASVNFGSKFCQNHFIPNDKIVSVDQEAKSNGKLSKSIVGHASQWRDVPTKEKGISKVMCRDTSAKCINGTMQVMHSRKEHENSNISSGSSAPAVTQLSVEVSNMDSSNADAGNTECVSNLLVDEGSGIDKCWSSDDAYKSERSSEFLGDSCETSSKTSGSSLNAHRQSSRSLLDELKLINSLTWRKVQKQIQTGMTLQTKDNPGKTFGVCFNQHSTSEHRLSISSSMKKPTRKRDIYKLYNDNEGGEVCWKDSKAVPGNCEIPEESAGKKYKRDSSTAFGQCLIEEQTHSGSRTLKKLNSVGCTKSSFNLRMNRYHFKSRPIVCGEYGELSNGECVGDMAKPAKIVSLSRVLKSARRFAVPKRGKPTSTSVKKLKKTIGNGSHCLNTKKESRSHYAAACGKTDNETTSGKTMNNSSRDNKFAEDLPIFEADRHHRSKKDCMEEDSIAHAQLTSKIKEIRKRSIYELTVDAAGKGLQQKSSSLSERSKCLPEVTEGNILRNGDNRKHGFCKVNEISPQEQTCSSLLDSDSFCCVCGSSNKDDMNHLLECNKCLIRVHQACYGVSRAPKGHWYCRPCRARSRNIVCVLCGYGGGAMTRALQSRTIVKSLLRVWNIETNCKHKNVLLPVKTLDKSPSGLNFSGSGCVGGASFALFQHENTRPLASAVFKRRRLEAMQNSSSVSKLKIDNSITAGMLDSTTKQWVHMVCGLWTPGTRCPNVDTMSAFDVSGAPRPRADVVCSICSRPGGSCIKCRVLNCSVPFHPWCAHQKGLLQSEVEGADNEHVGFYGRCLLHATHPMCKSDSDPADMATGVSGVDEITCARTEGYKGRKRDGFWHNYYNQSKRTVGCYVPQEQLNAWIHINGQKSCIPGFPKLPISDMEHDCRKEYARYKQGRGWKHLVVYKSGIHALGLYTSRFISRGEMVVEYVGEIVGQRVSDKREKEYQSGRKLQYKSACYFFRIDKEHVIDATRKGGIARFVNHSCLPNCVAKVISIRNEKKVVFFAERDIFPGEEITYDYHFNHEDEGKKIPCFCNSKNCRRYLN